MTSESRPHIGPEQDRPTPAGPGAAPGGAPGPESEWRPPWAGTPAPNPAGWGPQPPSAVHQGNNPGWAPHAGQPPAPAEPDPQSAFPPPAWAAPAGEPAAPSWATNVAWSPAPGTPPADANPAAGWGLAGGAGNGPAPADEPSATPGTAPGATAPSWAGGQESSPHQGTSTFDAGQPASVIPEQRHAEPAQPYGGPQMPAQPPHHDPAPPEARGPEPVAHGTIGYEPGPPPGLAGAQVLPLPPQPTRIPGAALAASPPADFPSPAGIPAPRPPADQMSMGQGPDRFEQAAARTEAAATVSASASVPLTSLAKPPADFSATAPAPQPRLYGRAVSPDAVGDVGSQPEPPAPQSERPAPAFSAEPPPANLAAPGSGKESDNADAHLPPYGAPGATPQSAQGTGPTDWGAPATPHAGSLAGASPGGWAPNQPAPAPGVASAPSAFSPPPGYAPTEFPAQADFPGQASSPEQANFSGTPTAPPPVPPSAQPVTPPSPAEQERFNAFQPEAAPSADTESENPPPQVRNGRVLLAVLTAAVLILAIPLGLLWLLGMIDRQPDFNPAIGACVKQADDSAVETSCDDPDAYRIVAKVDDEAECGNPHISLTSGGKQQFLCLQPAGPSSTEPADGDTKPGDDNADSTG